FCTVVAAVSHVKRHELPRLLVHRAPDPLCVRLLLHEAPHRVRFHLKTPDEPIAGRGHGPHMQMVKQRCTAGSQKTHAPSETDANRAAKAMEGDCLTEYACHQCTWLRSDHVVCSVQDQLSTTALALMVLCPSMHTAVSRVSLRTTGWTRLSHDHSALLPP